MHYTTDSHCECKLDTCNSPPFCKSFTKQPHSRENLKASCQDVEVFTKSKHQLLSLFWQSFSCCHGQAFNSRPVLRKVKRTTHASTQTQGTFRKLVRSPTEFSFFPYKCFFFFSHFISQPYFPSKPSHRDSIPQQNAPTKTSRPLPPKPSSSTPHQTVFFFQISLLFFFL